MCVNGIRFGGAGPIHGDAVRRSSDRAIQLTPGIDDRRLPDAHAPPFTGRFARSVARFDQRTTEGGIDSRTAPEPSMQWHRKSPLGIIQLRFANRRRSEYRRHRDSVRPIRLPALERLFQTNECSKRFQIVGSGCLNAQAALSRSTTGGNASRCQRTGTMPILL